MKRSPTSSCSSSSSSSCVVAAGSCNSHEETDNKKPKHKRARRCRQTSDESRNDNAASPISGRRSSIYRGVTRHRWTGRFEAHLWDKSSWNNIQNKKGRQVYLGAYDSEEAAARTYDLAALKYWGPETTLNFPIEEYKKEMEEMQNVSKEEYLASLRRRSSGFSRGVSKYRGVARHHHNGRWEARIGRVLGNKYLYLGTYNTQEEAAEAYDMAAIQYRGANAVTNFDISNYIEKLKKKGVHVDLPQQPLQEKINPDSAENLVDSSVENMVEVEVKQQHKINRKKKKKNVEVVEAKVESQAELAGSGSPCQLQYTRFSPCVESDSTIIDPVESQGLDHPFSFCMGVDVSSFPSLPVSDLPLPAFEKYGDLLDDCKGFEDNIDLIFEVGPDENIVGLSPECVMDDPICGPEHNILELGEAGRGQLLPLSSSTTSSPASSVSCNYCV